MGIAYNLDFVENSISITEAMYPDEVYVSSEHKDFGCDSNNNYSRNSKKKNRDNY